MTYLEAYYIDDGIRYKNLLQKDAIVQKIIKVKNQQEWALMKDYDRPLMRIKRKKVGRMFELIKMLIP